MSKKRSLVCLLVSLCLIVGVVAGCAKEVAPTPVTPTPVTPTPVTPAPVKVKPIKFIASSPLGPLHVYNTHMMEPLFQRLEAESGGRITADIFVGGELAPMGEEIVGLEAGTFDYSNVLTGYRSDIFPVTLVGLLPLVGTRAHNVLEAYRNLMHSEVPLKDNQTFYDINYADRAVPLKVFFCGALEGYYISTTGARVEKPEDLKGLTLRGSGLTFLIYLEKLGATPVSLAAMDMYDAMQRGTIEGSLYSIGDWKGYGFQELFRYVVTGMNAGHWTGSSDMMTEETWAKLPADIQEMWERIAYEQQNQVSFEYMRLQDWQIGESIAKYGCEFVDVGTLPELQKALYEAGAATWGAWIDIVEAEGYPARAAAKLYMELILEAGGFVPDGVEELFD